MDEGTDDKHLESKQTTFQHSRPRADAKPNPWIMTSAAFVIHLITGGVGYNIGVYYLTFLEVFNETHAVTSWVGSLNLGLLCASGPLASLIIERLGVRIAIYIGALMSAAGIGLSSLSFNIYMLLATLGVLTGVGYGIAFTACVVAIGVCIDPKYRAMAMGLSFTGAGLGSFIYPFLANAMLEAYDWRGALLITSGFTLNIAVCGLFMKTDNSGIKTNRKKQKPKEIKTESIIANGNKPLLAGPLLLKNGDLCTRSLHSLPFLKPQNTPEIHTKQPKHCSMNDISGTEYKQIEQSHASSKGFYFGSIHMLGSIGMFDEELKGRTINPESSSECKPSSRKFYVFTLYKYWLLLVNIALFTTSLSAFLTHIMAYTEYVGMTSKQATLLMALYGGGGIIGRLILGALTQKKPINTYMLYVLCCLLAGSTLILMTFWVTYAGLITGVIIYAIAAAAFGPVLSEVSIETCGVEHFSFGFGFIMVAMAVGSIGGPPTAGWLYDITEDYRFSFYFAAVSFLASALLMSPPAVTSTLIWKNRHNKNTQAQCDQNYSGTLPNITISI